MYTKTAILSKILSFAYVQDLSKANHRIILRCLELKIKKTLVQ